ncbi:hypothetical protein Dimus_036316, partial [Dionaea muscipula]
MLSVLRIVAAAEMHFNFDSFRSLLISVGLLFYMTNADTSTPEEQPELPETDLRND